MLASARPKGKRMATLPIYRYITLLKLNSTDLIAVCISLKKNCTRKRWSSEITAAKGVNTNINSFCHGNISEKTGYIKRAKESRRGKLNSLIILANMKESLMQLVEYKNRT